MDNDQDNVLLALSVIRFIMEQCIIELVSLNEIYNLKIPVVNRKT